VEGLFYDPFNILDNITFSGGVIDGLERIWKDVVMAQLRNIPFIGVIDELERIGRVHIYYSKW
jgi:hypothetical protein